VALVEVAAIDNLADGRRLERGQTPNQLVRGLCVEAPPVVATDRHSPRVTMFVECDRDSNSCITKRSNLKPPVQHHPLAARWAKFHDMGSRPAC
jgi:hypothetical protein